jgi:hypothetical protein
MEELEIISEFTGLKKTKFTPCSKKQPLYRIINNYNKDIYYLCLIIKKSNSLNELLFEVRKMNEVTIEYSELNPFEKNIFNPEKIKVIFFNDRLGNFIEDEISKILEIKSNNNFDKTYIICQNEYLPAKKLIYELQ